MACSRAERVLQVGSCSVSRNVRSGPNASSQAVYDAVRETACLIVDVQLSGMKGPELQDRLMAEGYRILIIFVTGYCDDGIRDQVLRAGAIAYLTKPWCERTLSGCLERAFAVGAR
jgi:FixJ family two-component response regulator